MHDDPYSFELVPPQSPDAPEQPASTGVPESGTGGDTESDTLSPAVRRLVRQYGLDASTLRGTGPGGRIRVTDVMAHLGGRAAPSQSDGDEPEQDRLPEPLAVSGAVASSDETAGLRAPARYGDVPAASTASTVFEVDLDALLEHSEGQRALGADVPLVAYFAAAAVDAFHLLPLADASPRLEVLRSVGGGTSRTTLEGETLGSLHAIAHALRERGSQQPSPHTDETARPAPLALYDYGASGCLFATALPLAPGQAAMLGIGRPRRRITIRDVAGERVPRAVRSCHLTLTYDPARISLEQANRFVAAVVRYRPLANGPDAS